MKLKSKVGVKAHLRKTRNGKVVPVRRHNRIRRPIKNVRHYAWIESTLVSDEYSSDKQLEEYFIKEGNMSEAEAKHYVKQRNEALEKPLIFSLKVFGDARQQKKLKYINPWDAGWG